eukprot:CAMPEP_0201705220 /NCGR_PEP_ID=MMETSP0578-20130828/45111_1 /ASSEMBLY_ACC=CAM_ASM_000663 /TAXON_ID=267565 /ORGANISM="Skeletonema grethea, Strain CCMP 1804" /LENGTH=169 /DNA_ID=CAMNT_0048193415 /DNA_START=1 /DNA_END=507 /DNA_ORIENTATION=+
MVLRNVDGFLSSNFYTQKLMARRVKHHVAANIPLHIMLEHGSNLYLRRSYDDNSDEELFSALLSDKSKTQITSTSPISSLDTSAEYAHLANVTSPSPSIKPEEIVPLIMIALKNNDAPDRDAGLKLVWEFATDTTQYVFRNNRTEFIESCHETADEFPTSFYGVAMNGQ